MTSLFTLLGQVVGQAAGGSGFDFFQALGSIGVGGLLAVPFVIVWRIAMTRIRELEDEVKGLNDARLVDLQASVLRERELSDSMAPLLANAAEALRDTPGVFDRAIEKAQRNTTTDLRMRQMELAMDELLRKKFGGQEGGSHAGPP